MKRLLGLAAILLAAACVAACNGIPASSLIPPSADVAVLQADTTLDGIYNATAQLYLAAAPSLSVSLHAQAKGLLQKARPIVQAADHAQALGDATTFQAQYAEAMALINQVKALLPAS